MSAAKPNNRHELPRLSIAHLLILTLTCGISLALIAPSIHSAWQRPDDDFRGSKLAALAVPALDHLAIGIKVFGVAVLIRERLRFGPMKFAPGHWYFLAAAPVTFGFIASQVIPVHLYAQLPAPYNLLRFILCVASAIIGIRAVAALDSWPWRVCLALYTASLLTLSFYFASRAAEMMPGYFYRGLPLPAISIWGTLDITVLVTALAAVAGDITRRNRRDWLHCFAVAAMLPAALSILGAFGPLIARFWRGLYVFITG